mgnify:CR=1 FL=1
MKEFWRGLLKTLHGLSAVALGAVMYSASTMNLGVVFIAALILFLVLGYTFVVRNDNFHITWGEAGSEMRKKDERLVIWIE